MERIKNAWKAGRRGGEVSVAHRRPREAMDGDSTYLLQVSELLHRNNKQLPLRNASHDSHYRWNLIIYFTTAFIRD